MDSFEWAPIQLTNVNPEMKTMIIRIIAIAVSALAISTCVAMAETGGYAYHDPLGLPKINPAGRPARPCITSCRCAPLSTVIMYSPVAISSMLSATLIFRRRRLKRLIVLIGSYCRKTSLPQCTLEMTREPAGCEALADGVPRPRS